MSKITTDILECDSSQNNDSMHVRSSFYEMFNSNTNIETTNEIEALDGPNSDGENEVTSTSDVTLHINNLNVKSTFLHCSYEKVLSTSSHTNERSNEAKSISNKIKTELITPQYSDLSNGNQVRTTLDEVINQVIITLELNNSLSADESQSTIHTETLLQHLPLEKSEEISVSSSESFNESNNNLAIEKNDIDELETHKQDIHNLNEIQLKSFEIFIEYVGGELPYRCRLCGKGFTRKQTAKYHYVVHTGTRPHICNLCDKSFRHKSALYKHKRSHSGIEFAKYPCETCGKLFKHKSYLSIHAVTHTEERPYVCSICGDTFRDRSARNKHVHAHSGIKPFSCEVCGKCFGRKGDYKSHLIIHTGERPYVCPICGQGFRSSSNCRIHARIHTNNYPYACDTCGKAFNQNWKLKEHKYTHTNEMPYVCNICNISFRYSRKLKKHMEKHINERLSSNSENGNDNSVFEIISVQPDISALID